MRWPARGAARPDPDPAASMRLLREVLDRPLDPGYESSAQQRVADGLPADTGTRSVLLAVTSVLIGVLMVTSALSLRTPETTATDERQQLVTRIDQAQDEGDTSAAQVETLRGQVRRLETEALKSPADRSEVDRVRELGEQVGASALRGPGVLVVMDDAPSDGQDLAGESGQPERVLARDLQQVTNGLWASGAEAVSINGQRLTTTASIRFAGEAIVVDFRGINRPYEVSAIGDQESMQRELADGWTGTYLDQLRTDYGLMATVASVDELTVPAAERLVSREATVVDQTASTQGGRR